jgi:hypothetical protein
MARPLSPRTSPTQVGAHPGAHPAHQRLRPLIHPQKSQRRGPLRNRAVCNRLALLSGWS